MQEFKEWLTSNMPDGNVGWKVLHKVNADKVDIGAWKIVRIDNEPTDRDLPFNFHLGYLTQEDEKNKENADLLMSTLREVTIEQKTNPIALCNLFILANRISGTHEENPSKKFLEWLSDKELEMLMISCIESVNDVFKNKELKQSIPKNASDWAMLFTSAQYFNTFNDPLDYFHRISAKLTGDARSPRYEWILKLSPLARARAVDFWGVTFEASSKEIIDAIRDNEIEAAFIAAYLSELQPNQKQPKWIDKSVIEILFVKHWINSGAFLLQHTYGIPFRSRNAKLDTELKPLYSAVLKDYFVNNKLKPDIDILSNLLWPRDLISITSWMHEEKIARSEISKELNNGLASAAVKVLEDFLKGVKKALKANGSSGVEFYSLHDEKYRYALAYMLIFLLEDEVECKKFQAKFYDVRVLFYGGWEAQKLAVELTEFVILVLLSIIGVADLEENSRKVYNQMLDNFMNVLWYSYVVKAENEEYIWNPEYAFDVQYHNYPKYLINYMMNTLKSHGEYELEFDKLSRSFNNYKTAQWPFERPGFK
jgi:hypothetical protein